MIAPEDYDREGTAPKTTEVPTTPVPPNDPDADQYEDDEDTQPGDQADVTL